MPGEKSVIDAYLLCTIGVDWHKDEFQEIFIDQFLADERTKTGSFVAVLLKDENNNSRENDDQKENSESVLTHGKGYWDFIERELCMEIGTMACKNVCSFSNYVRVADEGSVLCHANTSAPAGYFTRLAGRVDRFANTFDHWFRNYHFWWTSTQRDARASVKFCCKCPTTGPNFN